MEKILNGCVYLGNVKAMIPHGKGKCTWADGTTYEGEWEEGNLFRGGWITWSSGKIYEGDVSGCFLHGHGTLTNPDGSIYIGSWRFNIQHGFGRKQYSNFDIYDGSWKNGVHEGSGKYAWCNGDMYIGNWKAGSMCGRGIMKWLNGDLYDGYWSDGYRQGSGVYKFSDGSYYFGIWTKGLKDGRGTFYPAGSKCRSSRRLVQKKEFRSLSSSIKMERLKGLTLKRERHHILYQVKKKSPVVIPDDIKSYHLMLNLQLGIRYILSKTTPVPKRELRRSDFGQHARIRMYFPRNGSHSTPPHPSIDFYWKDYCPMVFRDLREMFKLDAADYMMSICGDDALRELSTSGKSGSIFFTSHDDKFVIKSLRTSELKVLLKMLPNYYSHVKVHDNTLITKFYGLHEITLRGRKKVQFVVMGNMFYTELRIHRRYDLKGSYHGRNTHKDDIEERTTFKDLDLAYDFHMDKSLRDALFEQIYLDCVFLESQHIIDYSLLLGLHFRAPMHMNSLLEPPDTFHRHGKSPADGYGYECN